MSGLHSRNKGRRGEMLTRNYFRARDWVSDRIPGSGAYSFKTQDTDLIGDVVITKNGQELRAEVKFHQNSFKSIYALLGNDSEMHLKIGTDLVSLCRDFSDLGLERDTPQHLSRVYSIVSTPGRTEKKLIGLKKLLKGADFLVIKINNRPLLFVRFR